MLESFNNKNKRDILALKSIYKQKHYKISLKNVDQLKFHAALGRREVREFNKFFYMKYRTGLQYSNTDLLNEIFDSLLLNRFIRRTSYPIQRFLGMKNFHFIIKNNYQDLKLWMQDYLYRGKIKPVYYKAFFYSFRKDLALKLKLYNVKFHFIDLMTKEIKLRKDLTTRLSLYRGLTFFIRNIWEGVLKLAFSQYSYNQCLNMSTMIFLTVKIQSFFMFPENEINFIELVSFIKNLNENFLLFVLSSIDQVFMEVVRPYYYETLVFTMERFFLESHFKIFFSGFLSWLSEDFIEFSIFFVQPIILRWHWLYLVIFFWRMIFKHNYAFPKSLFSRSIFFKSLMKSTLKEADFMLNRAKMLTIMPVEIKSYFTYENYKPIKKYDKFFSRSFNKTKKYNKKN